jgi:hypothetical protein
MSRRCGQGPELYESLGNFRHANFYSWIVAAIDVLIVGFNDRRAPPHDDDVYMPTNSGMWVTG